jgi:hypothetical protein
MRQVSDEADWYLMFDFFKRETDPNEKNELIRGLAGIRSIAILKESVLIHDGLALCVCH